MRKLKNIIILVAVLLSLSIFYLVVDKPTAPEDNIPAEPIKNTLVKINYADLSTIQLHSQKEKIELTKLDNRWFIKSQPQLGIDQQVASSLGNSICTIVAEQVVEEKSTKLDKYGLQNPVVTANLILQDGTKKTLYLGNLTPAKDTYYFRIEGDESVYTVLRETLKGLEYGISDLKDKRLPGLNPAQVSEILVQKPSQPEVHLKKTGRTIKVGEKQVEEWVIKSPYSTEYELRAEKGQIYLDILAILKVDKYVEEQSKDLSLYGLDKPRYSITLRGNNYNYTLLFGKETEEGRVYCKIGNLNSVFTIVKENYKDLQFEPYDWVNKSLYHAPVESLQKVTFQGEGKKIVMEIQREITSQGNENGAKATYLVNGKAVGEPIAQNAYHALAALNIEGLNKELVKKEKVMEFTFLSDKDKKPVIITYYDYNRDFYTITKDQGKADFLISKSQVQKAIKTLLEM